MNIQPSKPDKPDSLGQLFQLWGLTPNNESLARAYLTNSQADDSLLSGAERQIFPSFGWQEQRKISELLKEVTRPDPLQNQAKVLKFLWAVGQSSAALAALFEEHYIKMASDSSFRQRCQVLGQEAAAAMDAECAAAMRKSDYALVDRLHQIARTSPAVLQSAVELIADPQNSMADGVLAGVLLAAAPEEKAGLLRRLTGAPSAAKRVKPGTYLERQVETVLAWANGIVRSGVSSGLSDVDVDTLKSYMQTGDPSLPVPSISLPTAWQAPPEEFFNIHLCNCSAVGCMAAAAMFGSRHDGRMACALRVMAGLEPGGTLWSMLYAFPDDWDVSALDQTLPHIPGGAVTLLRFIGKSYRPELLALSKKLVRRYHASVDEALRYSDVEEYANLCYLLPSPKDGERDARLTQMRQRISAILEHTFDQGPQQDIVRGYLSGEGRFADSAAILKPIRNECRYYRAKLQDILNTYRKIAGWDEFACRCVVLSCLTCTGYGTSASFPTNVNQKENIDAFVDALIALGLPVRDCITVLAAMYENWYQESAKQQIVEAVQEHFVTLEGLDALADAALNGSAPTRVMAVNGLDALASRPERAQKGRKALIACAGDSSKQVQELLKQIYLAHPDWEQDYLALLKSKKGAQRSLAIQTLAGIGVEQYRSVLQEALSAEKNSKLIDQLTAVLGMPAPGTGDGSSPAQSPSELAAQVLKGGKKRKVQWLLDQPLPAVRRADEAHTAASEDQIAALLVAYADLGRMGRSDAAAAIAADLEAKDLESLACEVWELWLKAGAQSKTKWVLSFTAVFGGAAMTPKLIHAINDWPQNARGAIACDAVAALAVSPDPAALVAVDSISRKFKFRQVKAAAAAALENAARELGITPEELADRIVPTLDFSPDGSRVFDYGPRQFTVRLTPTLELAVTTSAGKAVKSMPAPGKNDAPDQAAAAYDAYKALKKQIKTTVSAQRARLEMALSAQRCWDAQAWRKLFVDNPIMHQFAISLIWGVYENGRLGETFRYMEDGSFNTVDEEEYTLPDGGSIGLVHPIELTDEDLAAWKQQLEDYEITQSIDQLSRPIYRLPAEQAQDAALETAAGRRLNDLSLAGKLQGMGWYRGSVVDGGGFYTFYREDPTVGIGVELHFSGSFVGGENEMITVYDAVFYRAGTVARGSYCYDEPKKEDIFPLGQVPARYYSEIVWQLERATASSTETDPDWKDNRL